MRAALAVSLRLRLPGIAVPSLTSGMRSEASRWRLQSITRREVLQSIAGASKISDSASVDLGNVGVLKLVDQDEVGIFLRALQHGLTAAKQIDRARDDVAERSQAFLL